MIGLGKALRYDSRAFVFDKRMTMKQTLYIICGATTGLLLAGCVIAFIFLPSEESRGSEDFVSNWFFLGSSVLVVASCLLGCLLGVKLAKIDRS
jgi:hypothetical protein